MNSGPTDPPFPRAPVPLPPEGPPAISPRARKTATLLKIPLQALPIPAAGRRITEKDVRAAARARGAAPMTSAARDLAAERGTLGLDLARKLRRRIKAADAAELRPVPLRCPALRVRMQPDEIEQAQRAARSVREVPQLAASAFIPAAPLVQRCGNDASGIAASFIQALGRILADDAFKPFRAVIDGDDFVFRGQLNIGYALYGESPETLGETTFQNVDRMSFDELQAAIKALPTRQKVPALKGAALVTLHDFRNLPLQSLHLSVERGQAALLSLSEMQSRFVHDVTKRESVIEFGWPIMIAADARVISPALIGFFTKKLKSFLEIPALLL